jgi:flagellar biosynthesis protein FlhA
MANTIAKKESTGIFNDLFLVSGVLIVLIMILVPLPSFLIDIFVALNFTVSVLILLVTMSTKEAVQFNIFPTFLLIVTLFRLALGILLTRALMLTASAGNIVQTFGNFVVGGNYVVGIMIFLVLIIIQFVVITGGAQRVAEVAARFTLDAMPGKQMAIDADLNAGLIDEDTARAKRLSIAREADFYGSMDGATKFIRGDAIAAIIIILVNIFGGFVIGVLQLGMILVNALQTYTLLTVGAGIVLQVPALLISSAAGIIVTKASSENNLAADIARQMFSQQRVMYIASALSALALLIPGMPKIPFLALAIFFFYLGFSFGSVTMQQAEQDKAEAIKVQKDAVTKDSTPEKIVPKVDVDTLELEIGYGVIPLVDPKQNGTLLEKITSMRKKLASELGIIIPPIRIRDNISLKPNNYVIKIKGADMASGEVMNDRLMAMNPGGVTDKISGYETIEPAFGLSATWITQADKERAQVSGYTVVDASTVIITHITEIIRKFAEELLGRQEVKMLIDNVKEKYPTVVEELIPELMTIGDVQKVLAQLLSERIPIRNLVTILEILADNARVSKNIDSLTSNCRQGIARQITKMYQTPKGIIVAITLDPALEQKIADSIQFTEQGSFTSLSPVFLQNIFKSLYDEIEKVTKMGYQPIVLCSTSIRPHFKKMTVRTFPNLIVLAYNEILADVEIQAIGILRMNNENQEV